MATDSAAAPLDDEQLSREERIGLVLAECSDLLSAGSEIDIAALVRAHPDLSPELEMALEMLRDSNIRRPCDTAPRTVGNFSILREVGRGGMGIVYEAMEVPLRRRAALKVLARPAGLDASALERFLREARAAARLHHTHIVTVFGAGEDEGVHFYTMQFVDGCSLDRVIAAVKRLSAAGGDRIDSPALPDPGEPARRIARDLMALCSPSHGRDDAGAMGPADDSAYFRNVARIGAELADALAYAHGEGILHRDVKPSNILVDLHGVVRLSDFGLARDNESEGLTRSGEILGTVAYMAPERFEGRSDQRSDVYGLGLTLYEMLTLQPAFRDSDRGRLVRSVLETDPPRPRRINRRVPFDLEAIVLKASAREPDRRYRDAAELAEDLRRSLYGEPILARASGTLERVGLWCRRKPAMASLAATIAVLLVVVAAGSAVFAWNLRERLYDAYLSQAQAGRWSGRPGRRVRSLEAVARAASIHRREELRDEAVACLALADMQESRDLAGRDISSLVRKYPDPTMERYATYEPEARDLVVRRVADDDEVLRLSGPVPVSRSHCLWSPDGQHLAESYGEGSLFRVRLWHVDSRRATATPTAGILAGSFGFSNDSRRLAIVEPSGEGHVLDTATGADVGSFTAGTGSVRVQFSPGDDLLAILRENGPDLQIVDLGSGSVRRTIAHPDSVTAVSWSPDGRVIATSCLDHRIYLWKVGRWELFRRLEGHTGAATGILFSPRGELLFSGGWDGTARLWDPWSGELLVSAPSAYYPLCFYAGGRRVAASVAESVFTFDIIANPECRTLSVLRSTPAMNIDFHPSGRLLSVCTSTGSSLWDLETSRELPLPFYASEILFLPGGESFLGMSARGGFRWPIAFESDGGVETCVIGPPERFEQRATGGCSIAADGSLASAAVGDLDSILLIDLERPAGRFEVGGLSRRSQTALSPDGRWFAAGTWHGTGARVWEVTSRAMVADLPVAESALVSFSSCSSRLAVIASDGFSLFECGTWRLVARTPGSFHRVVAFSPDGAFLAVCRNGSPVELVDPRTARSLGTLDHGSLPSNLGRLRWSPDSATLAVASLDGTLRLWDMRAIRARLREFDLDWEVPALPEVSPAATRATPGELSLRVLGAERIEDPPDGDGQALDPDPQSAEAYRARAWAHYGRGQWAHAADDLARALELAPGQAVLLNGLAWILVAAPPLARDPERALPLIERALEIEPRQPEYLNTLGAVYYRLGRFQDALDTLLPEREPGGSGISALDGYFIAMSLARLGQQRLARYFYHKAMEQTLLHPPVDRSIEAELERFRAEAEGVVLGSSDRGE